MRQDLYDSDLIDNKIRGKFGVGDQNLHTGAGAISLATFATVLVTTGANALTLADGYDGQFKVIGMLTDGGDGTLTPTNLRGGTTLTFGDIGDCVLLWFFSTKWNIVANNGVLVA